MVSILSWEAIEWRGRKIYCRPLDILFEKCKQKSTESYTLGTNNRIIEMVKDSAQACLDKMVTSNISSE